jgi:hypothetical protein
MESRIAPNLQQDAIKQTHQKAVTLGTGASKCLDSAKSFQDLKHQHRSSSH